LLFTRTIVGWKRFVASLISSQGIDEAMPSKKKNQAGVEFEFHPRLDWHDWRRWTA